MAEKKLSQFIIKATGTGGHGSVPHKDSANEKVINASARILSYKWPLKPTAVASAYIDGIFRGKKEKGYTFKNLREALKNKRFRASHGGRASLQRASQEHSNADDPERWREN